MALLIIDKFESQQVCELFQALIPIHRMNLVPLGVGDYLWVDADGQRHSWEHKAGGEMLQLIGGRLDEQLEKHIQNSEVVGLIISDMITPTEDGSCQVWHQKFNQSKQDYDNVFIKGRKVNRTYSSFAGYIGSLELLGVQVMMVPNLSSMVWYISSIAYNTTEKKLSEHTTLNRFLKPRSTSNIPINKGQYRSYVESLMGLKGARVGQQTGEKLIKRFGTPYAAMTASDGELDMVLGPATGKKFREAIGR